LSALANLLSDCDTQGIRLLPSGDNDLTIDAPPDTLTPDLLDRLKTHKSELLVTLRPKPNVVRDRPTKKDSDGNVMARTACRCGSWEARDVLIHDGQSVRRDCVRCGRFLEFPVWYGKILYP
jgi:hypothetical protein